MHEYRLLGWQRSLGEHQRAVGLATESLDVETAELRSDVIEFSNLRGLVYDIGKPVQIATVLKDGRKQPVNLIVADLPQEDDQ